VVCAESGVDVVFVPSVEEMYPSWPAAPSTTVSVRGVSERWEGASRPGHFDGVATVVAKLFTSAGPCRAYFGLKDFQQLAVVRRMASELSLPVEVIGCPIVREPDGLALSSRNVRLSATERRAATALSQALAAGRAALAGGAPSGAAVTRAMRAVIDAEPLVHLDYAVVVDTDTLEEVGTPGESDEASLRLLVAAQVGPVRLIDNSAAPAAADDVRAVPVAADPARRLERIG
jgi:pantoate--beta-alanine ligase